MLAFEIIDACYILFGLDSLAILSSASPHFNFAYVFFFRTREVSLKNYSQSRCMLYHPMLLNEVTGPEAREEPTGLAQSDRELI